MTNIENITKTLNAHLLAYHKDKAKIWGVIEFQEQQFKLNKINLDLLKNIETRVSNLEKEVGRQMGKQASLSIKLSQLKQPKQNWLSDIISKIKS